MRMAARVTLALLLLAWSLFATAELYRWVEAPKPIGQGNDIKQINERLEALREKERQRIEAEQAQAAKREKARQKICKERLRHYNRMDGDFVYERDDGSVYQVSRDQAEQDQAELREWLDENCPGS